jgi:hypothetical protein
MRIPMGRLAFLSTLAVILLGYGSVSAATKVNVDYVMAEKAIDWLEFINQGATDQQVQDYFIENVAPTKGCQSIIHHWSRFMEWDNEKFLQFILTAMGRVPTNDSLKNDDGSLTGLGRRSLFWHFALENPQQLRSDLAALQEADIADSAQATALKYLPDSAKVNADFYVVMFGGSSAYSVGDENGFDLLQLPRRPDSSIDVGEVLRTFAHEMHHCGFDDSKVKKQTQLVGIIAAEGMPTYFIDGFPGKVKEMAQSGDVTSRDVARVWQESQSRLPKLYQMAEQDIKLCLADKADRSELFDKWMGGIKGPAYVLGADIMSVIAENLGVDSARVLARDCRQMLSMYNHAASLANNRGEHHYIFDQAPADQVARF